MNYVVLLCIKFVILLIEEKVMSYVTVSEGHGHPLVFLEVYSHYIVANVATNYFTLSYNILHNHSTLLMGSTTCIFNVVMTPLLTSYLLLPSWYRKLLHHVVPMPNVVVFNVNLMKRILKINNKLIVDSYLAKFYGWRLKWTFTS